MPEIAPKERRADGTNFSVLIYKAADLHQMIQRLLCLAVPAQNAGQLHGKAVKKGDRQQQAANFAVPIAEKLLVKIGEHLAEAAVDRFSEINCIKILAKNKGRKLFLPLSFIKYFQQAEAGTS